MEIWRRWWPRLSPVRIAAPLATRPRAPQAATACCFSGGVDSFYSVLRRAEGKAGRVDGLVFIHGFDVPLGNSRLFDEVATHLRAAALELSLPLWCVSTNLRQFTDPYADWGGQQHGAALAGVGLFLSPRINTLLIPASRHHSQLIPWGSHPATDPLWSNEATRIEHDGCEASRLEKIVGWIARSPVALQHLRVCWENRDKRYNCGDCEKCLRTMVGLHLAGALQRCSTFSDPPAALVDRLTKLCVKSQSAFWQELLDALDAQGDRENFSDIRHVLRRKLSAR